MAIYLETKNNAGLIKTVRSRETGLLVSLYHASEAGLEDDPATPYALVCEEHNHLICLETRKLGEWHMSNPKGWCEVCMGVVEADY